MKAGGCRAHIQTSTAQIPIPQRQTVGMGPSWAGECSHALRQVWQVHTTLWITSTG